MSEKRSLNRRKAVVAIIVGVFGLCLFDGIVSATVYCITGPACVNFATANAVHELNLPFPDMASCTAACW